MKICEYGCGKEAKFPPRKGMKKWCCSKYTAQCPEIRKLNKEKNKGKKLSESHKNRISTSHFGIKHSKETKRKLSKINKGKKLSDNTKRKIAYATKDKKNHFFGRKHSKNSIVKMSLSSKLTIEKINIKYKFFSQVEQMRYNPDKPGEKEIQVHCKNNECINSKEKMGWFTPTYIQIYERIRQLEKDYGNEGCYFYCSNNCKNSCPLYYLRSDPYKDTELPYTQEELNIWKDIVKELDNNQCQYCGTTKNIHVHHIIPVKLEPLFSLDPENGICLCEECHYKIGHKLGSECSTGNLASIMCMEKINA